jgi:hypothetical protein
MKVLHATRSVVRAKRLASERLKLASLRMKTLPMKGLKWFQLLAKPEKV